MGRSVKKGPFTDTHLEAKLAVLSAANEKKVVRHVLAEGDVISIGETSLQYRREMKRE